MRVIKTEIEDVVIIEPQLFEDERGYFYEVFNARNFAEAVGKSVEFVQQNESRSTISVF